MAKKRKRTEQQILKSKERANLRRRIKRTVANVEKEVGADLFFDVNQFLDQRKKPLTAKQLSELRGQKLLDAVRRNAEVYLNPTESGARESVPYKDYQRAMADMAKAKELSLQWGSVREINSPDDVKHASGFANYAEYMSKASHWNYWVGAGKHFVNNFLSAFSTIGENSLAYRLLVERMEEIGLQATVKNLSDLVYANKAQGFSYFFDSDQTHQTNDKIQDILEGFQIEYVNGANYYMDVDELTQYAVNDWLNKQELKWKKKNEEREKKGLPPLDFNPNVYQFTRRLKLSDLVKYSMGMETAFTDNEMG